MFKKNKIIDSNELFKFAEEYVSKKVDTDFKGEQISDFTVLYWGPLWNAVIRLAQSVVNNPEKEYTPDEKLEIAYANNELNLNNELLTKEDYKLLTHYGYNVEINILLSLVKRISKNY